MWIASEDVGVASFRVAGCLHPPRGGGFQVAGESSGRLPVPADRHGGDLTVVGELADVDQAGVEGPADFVDGGREEVVCRTGQHGGCLPEDFSVLQRLCPTGSAPGVTS